ncbi:hypothetical protein PoB_002638900 [Plakobranchus ocellatus]|uniref:Uncharacterized protein n=1 Tax=Plakobranchus ocellatus TaxID=259542 RepID=A0AAV3ZX32_9GAST|nr:hypothetical protein PoB_002638900 [Plakobranchus ocellatus]
MNSSTCDGADFDQNTSVRGRRRQRNPENWAFNIAKRKRNKGEENIDKKGKQVKSREMQYDCGESTRENICHNFWQLGCLLRQRDFLANNVFVKEKKRKKAKG